MLGFAKEEDFLVQGLEMRKASLQSETVLTDVFIGKKKSLMYGVLSKLCGSKLLCGILALPVIGALGELLVTKGCKI